MFVPILAYHNISEKFEWGINAVSPRLFEKQMAYLAAHGYATQRFDDYLNDRMVAEKPIIITFDDTYQDVYEHAFPILEKYGFTATIFVVTDFVGKKNTWDINLGGKYSYHLGWDRILDLSHHGWEVGSHTVTHADLIGLEPQQLQDELVQSKDILENRIKRPITSMSYPFNRCNTRIVQAVKQAAYQGACCLAEKSSICDEYERFTIPRRGVYAIDEIPWFKQKLKNHAIAKLDDIRQKCICACAVGSVYYNRLKKQKKTIANLL